MTSIECAAHEWIEDDGALGRWCCGACGVETTGCSECSRPMETSLLVCEACLRWLRKIPLDVAEWMASFDFGVQLINLRAIRYDRDRVTTSDDAARLPFGLDQVVDDPEDTRIAAVKHPGDAVAFLEAWATAWAGTLGDQSPLNPLPYLAERTLWAVQNKADSGWEQYLEEARQVRATVRRLLGIAPVAEPVPCVHCGGRVVREWTKDGIDDLRRCQRCRTEWPTEARLLHTNALVLHELPATHADALVTGQQARRIYPKLNAATLRSWVHRGHVPVRATDVRGVDLYRLGDITDRIADTLSDEETSPPGTRADRAV